MMHLKFHQTDLQHRSFVEPVHVTKYKKCAVIHVYTIIEVLAEKAEKGVLHT